jgi:valyl-tRNA synthetase
LRTENKVEPAKKLEAVIFGHGSTFLISSQEEIIKGLKTGLASLEVKESGEKIDKALMVPLGEIEVYLLGAVDEEKEKSRLLKEKENLIKLIALQEQKLSNQDFIDRAPENIVVTEKNKLENYRLELEKIIKII